MAKFIQIWFGDLPEQNYDCIQSTIGKLRKSDSYFFYTDNSKLIDKLIENEKVIAKFIPRNNDLSPDIQSDLLRVKLASEEPEMVYVDCDVKLKKHFNPKDNNISLAFYNGFPDVFYFHVNGNTEKFKEILERTNYEYLSRGYYTQFLDKTSNLSGHKYPEITEITSDYFTHYDFS